MSRSRGNQAGSAEGAEPAPESLATFENLLARLNQIVERLESGDIDLEESLRLFEEGVRLSRASQARLDACEKRVEELLAIDGDGNPVVRELDPA